MALLTREQILARKVAGRTETVPLSGGDEVEVRGLSRGEAAECGEIESADEVECLALHYGLVNPALTVDEVREWRRNDESGEVQKVVDVVQRLSGTAPGQGKDATKSVPAGRRARR